MMIYGAIVCFAISFFRRSMSHCLVLAPGFNIVVFIASILGYMSISTSYEVGWLLAGAIAAVVLSLIWPFVAMAILKALKFQAYLTIYGATNGLIVAMTIVDWFYTLTLSENAYISATWGVAGSAYPTSLIVGIVGAAILGFIGHRFHKNEKTLMLFHVLGSGIAFFYSFNLLFMVLTNNGGATGAKFLFLSTPSVWMLFTWLV